MRKEDKVFCNRCGKELQVRDGIIQEGIFNIEYLWGYFSNRDGEIHKFDLCEKCYNEMVEEFVIPITKIENSEMI